MFLLNRLAEEAAVTRDRSVGPARRASILLVDDHPPNLMALEAILEPLGSRLLLATSGAEAVEIASREELALILLDLQMPELDGLETAALLKKHDRCRTVPIIILTAGEPSKVEVAQGYATGAVDFLFKPLDPDVLRSKVAVFVQLHEAGTSRDSVRPRAEDGSGRLSERLLSARPADALATVEALVRIQAALTQDLDGGNLAQRLATEAVALTSAAGAAVHRLRATGTDEPSIATAGRLREALLALGPASTVLAPAFEGGRIVRVDNARAAVPDGIPRIIGSLIAVPIVCSRETEAVLVLVHEASEMFDPRDEELAAIAASQAAAVFENARLYEAARQARDRAELAELELRAGEARLRIALESAGLGTWEYNPLTGALRLDAKCRALLAMRTEVGFADFLALVHADDRQRVAIAFRKSLESDMQLDVEYRLGSPELPERWFAVRGQGIAEHRRAVRFIGVLQEVTAKKRIDLERADLLASEQMARTVAETANRAKDEFLATVSHELRNPLNAILGWSRVLTEDPDLDLGERGRKGLDVILRNAKAQVQLVEDILEVSRIVTGKLRIAVAPFELAKVVEAAVETMRPAAQAKRVALVVDVDVAVRSIVADEDRIQQILWNLLSNAMKFTPTGGQVTAKAWLEGGAVMLRVTDTGEGIAPDFLPFVFDRFRQFDGSTTRRHAGLGLGLAIVRHLAELHGGAVHANSLGLGRGASFTVVLPITPSAALQIPDAPAPTSSDLRRAPVAHAKPLVDVHILVLDDDVDMRDLIAMILEDAGALVATVGTVSAAMSTLLSARPHVAISDLAMPGEDGYAFAERVRAEPTLRGVPLVAMTAYTRIEDRQRVLAAGFDRHVPKPIEPDQLVLAINEVLGRS